MAAQHFKTVATAVAGGVTAAASAPTLGTDGVDISHAEALAAVLSAAAGQTITSGTLKCYAYMPGNAQPNGEKDETAMRWMRYPDLDWTVVGGGRDEPSGDKSCPTGVGRLAWVPDAMNFSGGASCQVTYSVRRRRG